MKATNCRFGAIFAGAALFVGASTACGTGDGESACSRLLAQIDRETWRCSEKDKHDLRIKIERGDELVCSSYLDNNSAAPCLGGAPPAADTFACGALDCPIGMVCGAIGDGCTADLTRVCIEAEAACGATECTCETKPLFCAPDVSATRCELNAPNVFLLCQPPPYNCN